MRVLPKRGLEIANRFLFDRHRSIRDIAIKHLAKNEIDVERILVNILSSTDQSALKIRCAILGLADIGAKQWVPLIENFINHSLPSIRKASLQVLAKLIDEGAKSYLLGGLKDESASVAKESARLANILNIPLSVDELLGVVKKTNYQHTLIVCMSCARKINKWDRLIFLLSLSRLLVVDDSASKEILDDELSKWDHDFNRSSTQPSITQIERLSKEYSHCKPLFTAKRLRLLEFTLRGCGINV